MRKRLTQVILSGSAAAAALALSLSATTASAATTTTWTVSPGGAITATGSGQVKDTKTGTVAKCTSIDVTKATLKKGSGLSGSKIGTITASSFSGCTIATISVTVTTEDLPWHLNAVSYDSSTGVTTGTLTGVELGATAPGCSATLEGTTATNGKIKVTYTNSSSVLKLLGTGGNLTAEDVSGCFGLVNDGDPQDASGSLTVSPEQTITSP
jgi:hypothetical protein